MTDNVHDPGPDAAAATFDGASDVAANPFEVGGGGAIRIGTASWTDPTMTAAGVFYPSGADSAVERLQFYASRFPLVEVDATYYSLPVRRTSELWVERTPPDFTFDIKAHALMTGQPTETKRLPKDLREALPGEVAEKARIYAKDLPDPLKDDVWAWFADGLEPLQEAGQLGSILLQYPRWFFTSSENRDTIEESVARLRNVGMTPAVEFRSASWFNDKSIERTLKFLGDREIPLVMVDGPQGFKSSVPAIVAATSPELAVVRFHGRRTETWEKPGIKTVERFRYLYDEGELEEWVPRTRSGRTVEADACPLQQLLRQLRRDECVDARGAAPGPGIAGSDLGRESNVSGRPLVWTGAMNATYVVTGREGRFRTLADEVETGDPGTTWFRTVGRHEIDRAYRLAGFVLGDAREAEDATQDALARAWRQRSSLRSLDSAQAWFDRILVNVCRDRLRRRRPRVRWADVDEGLPSPAADPFAALAARDAVLGAVATLPIDQRIVLVLRYWADLPVDAISDRLGVPAGTVKSRLHYAMRALRDVLADRP